MKSLLCSALIQYVVCAPGCGVGEMGLAQSSLALLCITRMQVGYEAIHVMEMPP